MLAVLAVVLGVVELLDGGEVLGDGLGGVLGGLLLVELLGGQFDLKGGDVVAD